MGFLNTVSNGYRQILSNVESEPGKLSFELSIELGDWSELAAKITNESSIDDVLHDLSFEKSLKDTLWKEVKGLVSNDVANIALTSLDIEVLSAPTIGQLKNAKLELRATVYYEMMETPIKNYIETLTERFIKQHLTVEGIQQLL